MIFTMDLEINPPEYVIHEGVITDLAIGHLKNGESREVITSLCFLASGRFDISAVVRCFGISGVDSRTARAHTTAVVKEMDDEVNVVNVAAYRFEELKPYH